MYKYKFEYYTYTNEDGREKDYTVITSPEQTNEILILDDTFFCQSKLTEVIEHGEKYGHHILRSDEDFELFCHNYVIKNQDHLKDLNYGNKKVNIV